LDEKTLREPLLRLTVVGEGRQLEIVRK